MTTSHTEDRVVRMLGATALTGVAVFAFACGAAQILRTDYSVLHTPLSFYLLGSYGDVVEVSYFVLAVGLVALGIGWYLVLEYGARSAAPLLMFVFGAIALGVTAAEFTDVPERPPTLHGFLHIQAAGAAFICVTVAMLLQAWRLRGDPRWRPHFKSAFALAAVTFAALWIYALVKPIPRGLAEKVVVVLILAWLWRSAWWLARERTD